jgi:predicted glycoside hydrolase/deacetylase ChbG (UPF0249 family)
VKRLIVNADDYGLTATDSAGIRQAHREGIVTSTTAMMNMAGVEDELHTALRDCPKLGLGVHLVLTAGKPLLPATEVPSITAISGTESFPKLAVLSKSGDRLKAEEVKAEWRAQIEEFIRAAGRLPDHLDSHHHTSYLTAPVFGAMLELAREYDCAIRMPLAGEIDLKLLLGDHAADSVDRVVQFLLPMLLASTDVRRPNCSEMGFYDQQATLATLHAIMDRLPEGVTEIMCHPSVPDETLSQISGYNRQRAVELKLLTNPELKKRLSAAGVELISFGEL